MNQYCPICARVTTPGRRWANGVCLEHPYMVAAIFDIWVRTGDALQPHQFAVIERAIAAGVAWDNIIERATHAARQAGKL